MSQATQLMDTWIKDRAITIGEKQFALHHINAEDAAFMVGFASTVMPIISKQRMFFMTYSVDMVSEQDFESIAAIKGWAKAKPIIDKSFTVNGTSLDKAVEPFDTGEQMIQFYCSAMSLIAKS